MQIILHIGSHKTGTSAIQHFSRLNRDLLLEHGIFWPEEKLQDNPNQHSDLTKMLRVDTDNSARDYIERCLKAAQHAGAEKLFLSGEDFYNIGARRLKYFKREYSHYDWSIIVYFRNIFEFTMSALIERAKHGRVFPNPKGPGSALRHGLDYSSRLNDWETIVGTDNVKARCYDLEKSDLIVNFFTHFGLDENKLRQRMSKQLRVNPSPSFTAISFLYFSDIITDVDDYHQLVKFLPTERQDSFFSTLAETQLAKALTHSFKGQYNHPKLQPFLDRLTKEPELAEPVPPSDDDLKRMRDMLDRILEYRARP